MTGTALAPGGTMRRPRDAGVDWFVVASALMVLMGVGLLKIAGAPMPRMYRREHPVP